MLQQSSDVPLNGVELVELKLWINHGEQITGAGLFVYEDALPVAHELLLHLEQTLPLEHHRQNIRRRTVVGVIQLD